MAQFTHYPTTKLFNNILPNINNLNHDIQEFLTQCFKSAYYAQSYSVQEPVFIKNPKKNLHAKNWAVTWQKSSSKLYMTNVKLRICI
jgi:hypothetical protein